MKVAVTGSIACGKSAFVRFLREAGEFVLDADDVVHELEARGGAAVGAIAREFGDGVLAPDGGIDRKRLAAAVFTAPDAAARRKKLEDILFPLVRARLAAFDGICVIPLLYESGWEGDFDKVVCIASREDLQIERMVKTRGYTPVEARARIAAQMPLAEKIRRADYVVENNSTLDDLRAATLRFLASMREG